MHGIVIMGASCVHHVCMCTSVSHVEWLLMVCSTHEASCVVYYPACYSLILINLQVAACELLHAMVLFLIGKSAQPAVQKKVKVTGNEKDAQPYIAGGKLFAVIALGAKILCLRRLVVSGLPLPGRAR